MSSMGMVPGGSQRVSPFGPPTNQMQPGKPPQANNTIQDPTGPGMLQGQQSPQGQQPNNPRKRPHKQQSGGEFASFINSFP